MRLDYVYFNYVTPLLRDTFITQLTERQKKILIVASFVFACLALCYVVTRGYCCSKIEKIKKDGDDADDSKQIEKDFFDAKEEKLDDTQLDRLAIVESSNQPIAPRPFVDKKLNGYGLKILSNGTEEGEFKNDALHGNGKRVLSSGKIEIGQFKEGQLVEGKKIQGNRIQEGIFDPKYGYLVKGKDINNK